MSASSLRRSRFHALLLCVAGQDPHDPGGSIGRTQKICTRFQLTAVIGEFLLYPEHKSVLDQSLALQGLADIIGGSAFLDDHRNLLAFAGAHGLLVENVMPEFICNFSHPDDQDDHADIKRHFKRASRNDHSGFSHPFSCFSHRFPPFRYSPLLPSSEGRDRHVNSRRDRKSTRLNSSHVSISYAVFCLKKKKCKVIC